MTTKQCRNWQSFLILPQELSPKLLFHLTFFLGYVNTWFKKKKQDRIIRIVLLLATLISIKNTSWLSFRVLRSTNLSHLVTNAFE